MSALASANPRNFNVKRIMKEYAEFQRSQGENDYFQATPCEDNLFEWHFTIRGPPDSEFEGGRYHGRILLPPEYVPIKQKNTNEQQQQQEHNTHVACDKWMGFMIELVSDTCVLTSSSRFFLFLC